MLSNDVSNFSVRLLAPGFPAVHAAFVPRDSDIITFITPYRTSSNLPVVFDVLEQGLEATMYSDSSLQNGVRSSDVKKIDDLIESVLFPSDVSQTFYGFRWLGFFKPQQAGIWYCRHVDFSLVGLLLFCRYTFGIRIKSENHTATL